MTIRATILPVLAAALAAGLLAAQPALAADKCADQIAATKAAADGEADAALKAKAIKILNDAETDLKDGNEAFCLDEVAAAKKTLELK
jgi:hypothetical protein